jgi:hypothetical protein
MSRFTVQEIGRIASDVVVREQAGVEVIGVTVNTGGSDYSEILVRLRGCHESPCEMVIGVFRSAGEPMIREEIARKLRAHKEGQPG